MTAAPRRATSMSNRTRFGENWFFGKSVARRAVQSEPVSPRYPFMDTFRLCRHRAANDDRQESPASHQRRPVAADRSGSLRPAGAQSAHRQAHRARPAGSDRRNGAAGPASGDRRRDDGSQRPRTDRHSALTACKWRLSALPVLTYFKYAALRVTENHHFRHVIF